MRNTLLIAGAMVSLAVMGVQAHADPILGFKLTDRTTADNTVDFAPATTVNGALVSLPAPSSTSNLNAIGRSPTLTPAGLVHGYSSSTTAKAATLPESESVGDYYQVVFTVAAATADSATAVSLSGISQDFRRSSSAAAGLYQWEYSFDGFASAGQLAGASFADTLSEDTSNGEVEPTVDLTTVAGLQNIAPGTTVTLRLYGYAWNNTNSSTWAIGRLASYSGGPANDLEIDGTTQPYVASVPEPTSLTLIGAGVIGLLARRRRA